MSKGTVNIHGKQYKTVALRVSEFRELCPIQEGWSIKTAIIENTDEKVIMQAVIDDPQGKIVGVGFAEEYRAASKINRTSALENAETSAIGRALAAVGLGGEEYASAEEVLNAISQQEASPTKDEKPPEPEGDTPTIDLLKTNLKAIEEKFGREEAVAWHKRMVANFYDGVPLDEMTLADQTDYWKHIQTKLASAKEE